MDTIKAFIEGLFGQYEDSRDIRQAKKELYQMMEDQYLDLKAQGKSENEAVGEVIAGIGTMEELEEELNFRAKEQKLKNAVFLTNNQIEEFLIDRKEFAKKIAFAVSLCIISPAPLIILIGLGILETVATAIGLGILFIVIAFAISIFVSQGMKISKYSKLEYKGVEMETEKKIQLQREEENYQNYYRKKLSVGIPLCVLAALPLIFTSILFPTRETLIMIAVAVLLTIVSIGVNLIVEASIRNESFNILLQKGDYSNKKANGLVESIGGVYWTATTAIYLLWSFTTMDWHITWVVWPIAGVLFGLLSTIITYYFDKKEEK